eukprot:scaffold103122_cov48-Cyclotella_meneghiniana.AAC.2
MTSQPTCYTSVEVPGNMEITKVTIETIGQAFGEKIIACTMVRYKDGEEIGYNYTSVPYVVVFLEFLSSS